MSEPITRFRGEFGWLSNMANVEIVFEGFFYHSVEAAYQSAKSHAWEWKIFCTDPMNEGGLIKKMSHQQVLRSDWDEIKNSVMLRCLRLKYADPYYRKKLLETGDREIIEGNFWNDRYWGFCLKTNEGQNVLGKLIMQVRDEIREELKQIR